MHGYKVLGYNTKSYHGGSGVWTPGKPRSVRGELEACRRGIHYCRRDQLIRWLGPTIWTFEDLTPEETIDVGDKMVTRKGRILERVEAWDETTARLFAADVAEAALVYIPESHRDPFVAAINAAREFARGEISDEQRAAAWAAAWAAARDAAWGAWAAARDAAWGAWAARAAARAAAEAAWAAWAAWDTAEDAAKTEILFDYLEGRRS